MPSSETRSASPSRSFHASTMAFGMITPSELPMRRKDVFMAADYNDVITWAIPPRTSGRAVEDFRTPVDRIAARGVAKWLEQEPVDSLFVQGAEGIDAHGHGF